MLPCLREIASDSAPHAEITVLGLYAFATGLLLGAEAEARVMYTPAVERAYEQRDRRELARETLKILRGEIGTWARASAYRFSQSRAKVDDQQLAEAWNSPNFSGESRRFRAHALSLKGWGEQDTIERRSRRMAERGISMGGKVAPPGTRGRAPKTNSR